MATLCAVLLTTVSLMADEPTVKSPLEPRESLQYFRLADENLTIELAACEPQVVDPVAIRFDDDGRMWAVEMRDYPNGPAASQPPLSQIVVLEDEDGDGFFEKSTLFADGLLFATGLQPWQGGAFVTLAGRVAYMQDTDGDGRADLDETWFTGFVEENPQLRANHPTLAMDGWIYVANGLRGGNVVDARQPDKPPVSISNRDFRFHPVTGECEAVSGAGQFGMAFDDEGNRFICDNRHPLRHVVLEDRYLQRNPLVAVPSVVQEVAAFDAQSRVYPISRSWTTSNLHAGQFTAACGIEIYRGDALPEKFHGAGFICEPTGNLVHVEKLSPAGASFKSAPMYEEQEFLATTDEWFRPVNLETGPDGALYVVDMYRAVIEHPQWVPDELKNRPDERYGDDRGRIYRITTRKKAATHESPQPPHPAAAPPPSPARGEGIRTGAKPKVAAADWSIPPLRSAEILDFEAQLAESAELRERLFKLAESENPRDRFRAALSLGYAWGTEDDKKVLRALSHIALAAPADVWTRRAVELSIGDHAIPLLQSFHRSFSKNTLSAEGELALVEELAALVGARNQPEEMARALTVPYIIVGPCTPTCVKRAVLLGLFRSLAKRGKQWGDVLSDRPVEAEQVRERLGFIFSSAARDALVASDDEESEVDFSLRPQAIDLLAFADFETAGPALTRLIQGDDSQDVRLAAIASLAAHRDERIGPLLLDDFTARTPAVRRAVLDAVIDAGPRANLLLDEIEARRIAPTELDRARADRLLTHKDAAIAARARQLLAEILPADRQQILKQYQPALQLTADPRRGLELFKKTCSTCHKIGDVGVNVAPDISDSRVKTPAQLLTDILQPNRAIDNNYISYAVVTKDGQSRLGIITSETGASVTLKLPENKVITLLRDDIEELRSTGLSLMPDGLEKNLPPQEMADVISFIKNWRYLDGKVPAGKGKEGMR